MVLNEHPWGQQAREWDRATRQPRRHGGVIGRAGCRIYGTILAAALNQQAHPVKLTYTAIAGEAWVDRSTVAIALRRLRDLGMLTWGPQSGRGNLFILLPPSEWGGEDGLPPAPTVDQAAG
jgi:hypothetical protein